MTAIASLDAVPDKVAVSVIATFTGVSERRIQQLAAEGILPKSGEDGGYPLIETNRAFWEYQVAKATPADVQIDKAAIVKLDRETAEITTAKARGELSHRPTAEALWVDAMVKVREWILRTKHIRNDDRTKAMAEVKALEVAKLQFDD